MHISFPTLLVALGSIVSASGQLENRRQTAEVSLDMLTAVAGTDLPTQVYP